MIALDTNILVRFFAQDDAAAYAIAERLFTSDEIMLVSTVLLETAWVMRSMYGYSQGEVADALDALTQLPNVHVPDSIAWRKTLAWTRSGLEFADAFHLAQSQGARSFASFDTDLVKKAARLDACRPVFNPEKSGAAP